MSNEIQAQHLRKLFQFAHPLVASHKLFRSGAAAESMLWKFRLSLIESRIEHQRFWLTVANAADTNHSRQDSHVIALLQGRYYCCFVTKGFVVFCLVWFCFVFYFFFEQENEVDFNKTKQNKQTITSPLSQLVFHRESVERDISSEWRNFIDDRF